MTAIRTPLCAVDFSDHALAAAADIIVLGTLGHTSLARILLGSEAERVVRLSDRPVLTVPLPRTKPDADASSGA